MLETVKWGFIGCGEVTEKKSGPAFSEVEGSTVVAGYADNGKFVVNTPVHFEMPLAELSLPGRHNLRNSLAAAIACLAYGIDPEVVRQGLSDFPGVEHRLEKAGTKGGIHFVNDSKATNVAACYCALESMTTPVVLILVGWRLGSGCLVRTANPLTYS